MRKAYLDCVNKTLKVDIEDQNYTFALLGDVSEVGTVRTKHGDFFTHFRFSNKNPEFFVSKKDDAMDFIQKGSTFELLKDRQEYKVVVVKGSAVDYFGYSYPNGINSYLDTFGMMMAETVDSVKFMTYIKQWAMEFEQLHVDTSWSGTDWQKEVTKFLKNKSV